MNVECESDEKQQRAQVVVAAAAYRTRGARRVRVVLDGALRDRIAFGAGLSDLLRRSVDYEIEFY